MKHKSINDKKLKVFTFSSTENVPFAHYVRWFVYADSEDSAREMIDTYLSINKFNFSDFHGGRQITKKEMKRMIDRGINYIELTPDNFMNKEEIVVNELIKEIQDIIYNVSSKYLKAEGWDLADIADYFVADVQAVEPGVIRAEIRGELEYEQLFELCSQLDKVIAVKFDRDAYFEPVEPGIAEAFIRTNVQACSDVTASGTNPLTMQHVQALIDGYGTKYFEAIPTSGGRELWFSIFDVGSYNIRIEDGKIIMISTDDPYDDVRIFRNLDKLRNYLEKQIAIGKQEADMHYSANASTLVTSSLNYVTPEMKQLKRALSKIYVDNDDQFHELVDSLLNNEPINLVTETKALKRAMDNMVVDNDEEKREVVYEVAKDLGVIESSTQIKATSKNKYCIQFKIGDEVRFNHGGGQYSDEVATISGYDKDGFYKVTWEDGSTSEGLSDTQLIYEDEDDIEMSTEIKAYTFDESEDGWGEDVEDILSQVFARAEDLMYEVRNTIRGANTDCETVEDLADYIRQLASEFEEAADELESL